MDRNYKAPRINAPITVNVDEWMKKSHGPTPAKPAEQANPPTPKEREQAVRKAREEQARWQQALAENREERIIEAELEKEARMCSNCEHPRRHFIDDYMCRICRKEHDG